MNLGLQPLLDALAASSDNDFVLATVIATQGPSYRKAGAMMLIREPYEPIGLVSGGCLEGDLREHARQVLASGVAKKIRYDLSEDDDALWGLGLGCGGQIEILLEKITRADGFGGLAQIARYWRSGRFCYLLKRTDENDMNGAERYSVVGDGAPSTGGYSGWLPASRERASFVADNPSQLCVPIAPPPRLLVCGAGPDATPLADIAQQCGWAVMVIDHRAAHAQAEHFCAGVDVRCQPLDALADSLPALRPDAAVVMSHHLENDARYVRALLATDVTYLGVLGPAARRDRVLELTGVESDARVHGPAGFDIGADLPQTIALSILAEAHAVLAGAAGRSLSKHG